ncbi:MAG: Ca-activated chloride channel [Blastocatellia bacterium]|jgi:VWFA-related protein|nr:Ca-activated chloride channel [Blastocatellia bacterium]
MKNLAWTVVAVILVFVVSIAAQTAKDPQRPRGQKPAITNPAAVPAEPAPDDVETLKIDTNLVTVPVIASSRTGLYITDLKKEEFKLSEDGVPQEIAFLAAVNAPFYVVLLLDTSDSTQDKLPLIQRAAISFLNQLGPRDRVKIISFDSEVRDLNDFSSDKAILRGAIEKTATGQGTRVYDAMQMALDMLRPIQQRKAIVLFTDGVDWHSDSSTFDSTTHDLDESGVIVYPIRFDTRAFTEQLARKQAEEQNGGELPTSGIIRTPPTGTTQTTFPSDDPFPVPTQKRSSLPIPPPSVLLGRGRNRNPQGSPTDPFPDSGPQPSTRTLPDPGSTNDRRGHDSISGMLDNLYLMADSYLKQIADRSGGQVYRADNVAALPQAFAAIADELRTQYLLGYYPINRDHDGAYRKIQVKTSRKDIAIRARPGYRARNGG